MDWMDISSRHFIATLASAEGSGNHHRDLRRVYLNADVMKVHNICTTDLIAVTGECFPDTRVRKRYSPCHGYHHIVRVIIQFRLGFCSWCCLAFP